MPFMLPDKYYFKHQFSFFLHDILAKIITVGERNKHFFHKIQLRNEKDLKTLQSIKQEDTYDTMVKMGYSEEMDLALLKQVYVAVLSDFTQFVYTALETSVRGKLSVTYSLLRKPFKDNLFILEWILSDPDEFLKKFKSSKSFLEVSIDKISPEKKLNIIKSASYRADMLFLPPEFIYELRYDKSKAYGFESTWQMANHLITSYKHYQTEEMNLNFVFSSYEEKLSQWEHLYYLLPSLLFYTVNICWTYYKIIQPQSTLIDDNMLRRLAVGYSICVKNSVKEFDNSILKNLPLLCQKCGCEVEITEKIENSIINKGYYICPKHHRNNYYRILSKSKKLKENISNA